MSQVGVGFRLQLLFISAHVRVAWARLLAARALSWGFGVETLCNLAVASNVGCGSQVRIATRPQPSQELKARWAAF
jgi:hypothetical protein